MKVIASRSPYIISVNQAGQTGSKLELFIWHKGQTEPTTPTYTLSKLISSTAKRENVYNISQYISENIEVITPTDVITPTIESNDVWCFCKVKRYKLIGSTFTLLDTTTYVGVDGYTDYLSGVNSLIHNGTKVALINPRFNHKYNTRQGYFNVLLEGIAEFDFIVQYQNPATNVELEYTLNVGEIYNYKIPYVYNNVYKRDVILIQEETFHQVNVAQICETKYTPIVCTFINRFGGWQYLTFFKSNSTAIEVKGNDYKMLPNDWNYNPLKGQKQTFNRDGMQTVKVNTGWVDEDYKELIQDLMLSQTILLDNKPVVIKTQSTSLKSGLNDKNINYEIEFEYSYSLINNVI